MLQYADPAAPIAIRGATAYCALAILAGPLYTDPGYEWIRHSVSELAGQATSIAWVLTLGSTRAAECRELSPP